MFIADGCALHFVDDLHQLWMVVCRSNAYTDRTRPKKMLAFPSNCRQILFVNHFKLLAILYLKRRLYFVDNLHKLWRAARPKQQLC
jgi:hypothetical protein